MKATALSGRPLEEKFASADRAYETAKKWIAAGFSDVCLGEEGKDCCYCGPTEIRQFLIALLNLSR